MQRSLAIAVGLALLGTALPAQVVLPPNMGVPDAAPTVPGPGYDLALAALAAGDYAAAVDLAEREYRGSAKIGADRWIDSIAAATVLGESLFEVGRFREAVARYEEALALQTLPAEKEQTVRTLMTLALDAKDWTGAKGFHSQLVKMQPTSIFVKAELARELSPAARSFVQRLLCADVTQVIIPLMPPPRWPPDAPRWPP